MVQADTVIGVIGAVLLVGIMAGVFMYEFQSADRDDDPGEAEKARFAAAYPFLNATEDIDGDGTPNYQDDDIDGDGIPNEEDPDVAVTHAFTGTIGPQAGTGAPDAADLITFFAGTGNNVIHVEMEYAVTIAIGAPQPLLILELLDETGSVVATGQTQYEGQTAHVSLQVEGGLPVGHYTVHATQAPTSVWPADTDVEGTATIHYRT